MIDLNSILKKILGSSPKITLYAFGAALLLAFKEANITDLSDWKHWVWPVIIAAAGRLIKDTNGIPAKVEKAVVNSIIPQATKAEPKENIQNFANDIDSEGLPKEVTVTGTETHNENYERFEPVIEPAKPILIEVQEGDTVETLKQKIAEKKTKTTGKRVKTNIPNQVPREIAKTIKKKQPPQSKQQ